MLTRYGVPFLVWVDEVVLPAAVGELLGLQSYVRRWRELLDV